MQAGMRWVVVVVLAVAGVGFWVLLDDSGASSAGDVQPVASQRESSSEAAPVSLPTLAGADPKTEPESLKPAQLSSGFVEAPTGGEVSASSAVKVPEVVIRGRVVDPQGRPVPAASVVYSARPQLVLRELGGEALEDARRDPEASSGPDGRFELSVPLVDEEPDAGARLLGLSPRLVVDRAPYALLSADCPMLSPEGVDVGDLSLSAAGSLTGLVLDEAGRAVAGARVTPRAVLAQNKSLSMVSMLGGGLSGSANRAETDASGRYLIAQLAPGPYTLSVDADGMRAGSIAETDVEVGVTKDLGILTLETGESIAGFVVDALGQPVEGARVRVSSMTRIVLTELDEAPGNIGREWQLSSDTDENGAFRLDGLTPGQYTVHARHPDYARAERPNVTTGSYDVQLRLEPLGGAFVRLSSARDASPIEGASLSFSRVPTRGFSMGGVGEVDFLEGEEALAAAGLDEGDAKGAYFVTGIGAGGVLVEAVAAGFAVEEFEITGLSGGATTSLELSLQPAAKIRGIVLDTDGEAVTDALVSLSEYVPPATEDVGFFAVERNVEVFGGGDSGVNWQRARTDAQGRFTLDSLPAGNWELVASSEQAADSAAVIVQTKLGDERAGVVLTLSAAGSLRGRVVEESGELVPDAEVLLKFLPPNPGMSGGAEDAMRDMLIAEMGLGGGEQKRVTTDARGEFLAEGLRVGRWEASLGATGGVAMGGGAFMVLEAAGGSGDDSTKQLVDVIANDESWVEIVRPLKAILSGRVLAAGEPVPNINLKLAKAGGFFAFGGLSAETDEKGRFLFEEVNAGDYTLSGLVPGAASRKEVSVSLEAGRDTRQDLVFAGQTLRGKVVDSVSGDGVADALITVAPVQETSGAFSAFGGFQVVTSFEADGGGGGGEMSMTLGGGSSSTVRTNAEGEFEVRFLEPGEYSVESEGGGYADGQVGPIAVEDGRNPADVEIGVELAARLSGIITDGSTGRALPGVPVMLSQPGGGPGGGNVVMAGANGDYSFENLEPGSWVVSVMGSGFGGEPVATETVQLKSGEQRVLDLDTEP